MLITKDVQVIKVLKDSAGLSSFCMMETADGMRGTLRMSPHHKYVDKKNMHRNLNVRGCMDVKHPLSVQKHTTEAPKYILPTFITTTVY